MLWRSDLNSRFVQFVDFCTALCMYAASFYLWDKFYFYQKILIPPPVSLSSKTFSFIILLSFLLVFLFSREKAYSYQRFTSLRKEFVIVSKVMLEITFIGVAVVFLLEEESFPRTFFLISFNIGLVLFFIQKFLVFTIAYRIRERGKNRKRIIVVGTGTRAEKFINIVHEHFGWGLDIVGLISGDRNKLGQVMNGIKVIGMFEDISEILRKYNPEEVIITVSTKRFDQLRDMLETCEREGVQVRLNSDFFGKITKKVTIDTIYGLNIISFNMIHQDTVQLILKRVLDIMGALIAIIIFSPFMIVGFIGILISDGRPIFYKWNVVGLNKKPFKSWKFRTMVRGADELKAILLDKNEMSGPVFKIRDDPRIFPFGKWLRKWSIDETPQLFSVLKGDMSLVGPRPAGIFELPRYESWQRRKLSVKPGLTCIWQVSGRNGICNFDEWVKLDLEYIDNWSFWLDLKILLKTIPTVLLGKGAS